MSKHHNIFNKKEPLAVVEEERKVSDFITPWLLPVIYVGAFLGSLLPINRVWPMAKAASALGLLTMLSVALSAVYRYWHDGVVQDVLTVIMALLVSLLSWVIVRFSAQYLNGEQGQTRFIRATFFTLACVAVLVTSHNIALIALSWSATSVGLHYLLTFYPERKAARIVAHKKFIVSRIADLCLLVGVTLIYQSVGSFQLEALSQTVAQGPLSTELSIAALMFAITAVLKTAQLPLHGWLIQVMEAPTPISALLHAGVVNMGGFVLIRIADLIGLAPVAQWLLIAIGSLTALLAGVVMMTRISIKVRLAWSTCAQMGFMLMEIGLGLYELALLHLVAHSLYKAYAFLSSGQVVEHTVIKQMRGNNKYTLIMMVFAPLVSSSVVFGSLLLWQWLLAGFELPLVVLVILSFGLAPLLWSNTSTSLAMLGLMRVALVTQMYFAWHWLFAQAIRTEPSHGPWAASWIIGVFMLLYLAQIVISLFANNPQIQRFYAWSYHGFFLDETFTRLTFKYWPARFSPRQAQTWVIREKSSMGDYV